MNAQAPWRMMVVDLGLVFRRLAILLGFFAAGSVHADDFEFFEKKIRPVLADHCYPCHSANADKLKGGLLLDTKAGMLKGGDSGKPAVVPGKPEASQLLEAIRYENKDLQMPPPKKGKLTDPQIADFAAWINLGAADPRTNAVVANQSASDKYLKARTHWAFQPIGHPAAPQIREPSSDRSRSKPQAVPQTPIDNFIITKLIQRGLQLSAPADKRTLIRRATFDLTGLPPRPEDVDAFIKDTNPNAFAKVVDRLLASPHYGERWGRYWLDVARFADTKGYVYGGREETKFIHSAVYRDWVIRALNDDMPYDRFLKLQIAADQMEGADLDSLAAMGYLTLGRRFLGVVHDIIDDRIDVVMRGTQALTVGCARCHDHKFDPIPTRDYYSLYGVFAGCNEREVPLQSAARPATAYLDFEKELRRREQKFQALFNSKRAEQSQRLRAKTSDYLTAVLNVEKLPSEEFYSFVQADDINAVVVRAWHRYLLSAANPSNSIWSPWLAFSTLQTNDFPGKASEIISSFTNRSPKVNPVVARAFAEKVPASQQEVSQIYGQLFAAVDKKWSDAADKKTALNKEEEELREVLYSEDSPASVPAGAIVDLEWYFDEPTRVELGKLSSEIEQWILQSPGAPSYAVILEDRPAQKNPHVFKRGNAANTGEEIPRQFLELLSGQDRKPFVKGSGRLELAEAIANTNNPLTARVFVNRLWLHHFGAGLVRTPSDFGTRAEPPSHPELLDWLSSYFMDNGWSIKKLHRLILLSVVYQQTSEAGSTPSLASMSSREAAPLLRAKLGSVPVPDRLDASQIDPENRLLWHMNRQRLDFESLRDALLSTSGQLDATLGGKAEEMFKAPFSKRRSVYGFIDRQFLPGALRIFDFANPDMHNPQRSETTVPQQALFFMNSPFVMEQSRALTARIDKNEKSSAEKIKHLYRLAYQREPTPPQLKSSLQFIEAASAAVQEEEAIKKFPSPWRYGYGELDETATKTKSFAALPHFSGEAWQGGKAWPDAKLGWAQLTAAGGHAGNDLQHAVIRRWIAPIDGAVAIEGSLKHEHAEGDGIQAFIVASRGGILGKWSLHNQASETKVASVDVKSGDTIDFIVSINKTLNNNDFLWAPVVRSLGPNINGYPAEWSALKEFSGPPSEEGKPLTPWEQYAQVLVLANEFLFVD